MLNVKTEKKLHNSQNHDSLYEQAVARLLEKIIPKDLLDAHLQDSDILEDEKERFDHSLPFFSFVHDQDVSKKASLLMLWKHRPHDFKFVFDMVSCWLCPGKNLNITNLFVSEVRLPELSEHALTVCEISLSPSSASEWEEIKRNLPILESELRLGVQSRYFAWKILEVKGLKSDEKTVLIQEQINDLLKRKPSFFDTDLITEMQHMLVTFKEDFIAKHESRYLTRLVSIQYLFRKDLRLSVKHAPLQRHLRLKLIKTKLLNPRLSPHALGVLLAINFIEQNEYFEEKHLLNAIKNYIPYVQSVEGSFITHRRGSEDVCTIYLEIEKEDGSEFSSSEITLLRSELPYDLQDRIEHLMHPVFMPRNEEDIMRNILNLSSQIKYVRDLPQVFISFDEQTKDSLLFTVIVVQVCIPGTDSIQELMQTVPTCLQYIHDRCKTVGMLRKKYAKQANVFRVQIKKNTFIRADGSLDLNVARQLVVCELNKILGEFRDYNGGMISKQNEQLYLLRQKLDENDRVNELLLENFFYSLSPLYMRSVLDIDLLAKLFNLLGKVIEERLFENRQPLLQISDIESALLFIISTDNQQIREELINLAVQLNLGQDTLAHSFVQVYNVPYLCFIYRSSSPEDKMALINNVEAILNIPAYAVGS